MPIRYVRICTVWILYFFILNIIKDYLEEPYEHKYMSLYTGIMSGNKGPIPKQPGFIQKVL